MADRGELDAAALEVVVLLLNYRGVDCTLACLGDLLQVTDVAMQVLVLDNASGGDEVARLQDGIAAARAAAAAAADVELIALPHNLGFTGGMNHGLALAAGRAPYALVLNNDMRLPKDFLRPLVSVLHNDANVAAVGPTILHPDGTVWAEGGDVALAANALRLRRHGRAPSPVDAGPASPGFLPGACLLLRLDAAAEVGYFDDGYFMYWEDVALCTRLRERGHAIVWLPWVRVEHRAGHASGGGRSPLRKYLMACNAVRYLRRHPSVRGWLGWLWFDVLLWPLALLCGPAGTLAKLRGTVAGLAGHRAGRADVARYLDGR